MKTHFEYDIFISYSSADVTLAEALETLLRGKGLKVWRDKSELRPGDHVEFVIPRALQQSASVAVLWSEDSVKSDWVRHEASYAIVEGKALTLSIVPFQYATLPAIYRALNCGDLAATLADPSKLLERIAELSDPARCQAYSQIDLSKLPQTFAKKLYGRDKEMADLFKAWDSGETKIFAFDAMGGAGKTTLVYHFVQALKASGWRGARSIFAWSFYSQGSNEDRQTSADDFFKAAYKHFSADKLEPPRDPHQKGVDLAHLVQAQRSLLILDGLEPLQYAAGRTGGGTTSVGIVGGVKDPGVKALLNLLADNNPGLCVVTTRIKLAELRDAHGVVFEPLDRLPLMAGIELLRDLGVEPGTPPEEYQLPQREEFQSLVPAYSPPAAYTPPPADARPALPAKITKELIEAVEELKGHALALTLIGKSLAEDHHGDIRAAGDLPTLPHIHPSDPTRDAYRVMRSIEIGLAQQIEAQRGGTAKPAETAAGRQLALLFFLGFFDRPADAALLPVVFPLAAADYLQPDEVDLKLAAKDLLALKKRLEDLADERATRERESRKQEIEREQDAIRAERDEAIEAARRVLVRRVFAGMAENVRDRSKIIEALRELARRGLIAKFNESGPFDKASIDCHPLVREYFGARLKELDGGTFRAAHGRLYDYYRYAGLPATFRTPVAYAVFALISLHPEFEDQIAEVAKQQQWPDGWIASLTPTLLTAPWQEVERAAALIGSAEWASAQTAFLPKSEAGMTPIFAAIAHGCAAEREDETWSEVYRPRVTEFGNLMLGVFGQVLAALASFFETPFERPSPRLSANAQALALRDAGFNLQVFGQLNDAVAPLRAAVSLSVEQRNWEKATNHSVQLSGLLQVLGLLTGEKGSVAAAAEALHFADLSRPAAKRDDALPMYGLALHFAGMLGNAEALFREAETTHHERLLFIDGAFYCDLLVARGRTAEVTNRAETNLQLARGAEFLIGIALFQVIQVRVALSTMPLSKLTPPDCTVRSKAEAALAALRHSKVEEELSRGLLLHAEAVWRCGDANAASEPLREAETIAKRGPMPLFLADAYLLRARIALSLQDFPETAKQRYAAFELIEKHSYGRAKPELAVLDAEIACAENAPNREAAITAAITAVRGEPYRDERTGITIDGGWWGLLPRLEALLPADHTELVNLRDARDAYNAERDACLAREDAEVWEVEDHAIAALPSLFSHDLKDMPHDLQRMAARQMLKQMRELRQQSGVPDADVSDELVRFVFAEAQCQELLRDVMRQLDLYCAPADLPFEMQRLIVTALVKKGTIRIHREPPPPQPDGGKKRGGWWPFGRKH